MSMLLVAYLKGAYSFFYSNKFSLIRSRLNGAYSESSKAQRRICTTIHLGYNRLENVPMEDKKMLHRMFPIMLALVMALFCGSGMAADKSTESFVPDDDKGPDIGAAPHGDSKSAKGKTVVKKTESKKDSAKEFVPDDDKGPDIGASPTK